MTFQIKAILMCHKTVKNTIFWSSHGFFSSSKIHEKPVFGRGSALDPAGRAYDASPDLLLAGAPVRSPARLWRLDLAVSAAHLIWTPIT